MHQLQVQFKESAVEVITWMSNYIPLFYMDVITYPWACSNAYLANMSVPVPWDMVFNWPYDIAPNYTIKWLYSICRGQETTMVLIWYYENIFLLPYIKTYSGFMPKYCGI